MNTTRSKYSKTLCNAHGALCITLLVAGSAFAEPSISNVSARQRWPWNSLVDVDFTISGAAAGEAFAVSVSGAATVGGKDATFYASSFTTEPIAKAGANRVVWDFGADYPDTKVDDLLVTVTATPFSDATPVYLVVDLSPGAAAESYPVRYTTAAPVHTMGQPDACKTSELWLKRVKAGTIDMGTSNSAVYGYKPHTCTLTEDFYLGIFPVTWGQYERIGKSIGRDPQFFTNGTCRATRPLDRLQFTAIRDASYLCPDDSEIYSDSILRRLRDRTGLDFDLPTGWQWEYACRAGSTATRYPGAQWRCRSNSYAAAGGYSDDVVVDANWTPEEGGTGYVDEFAPNEWGFYAMLGNVWEWCINRVATIDTGEELTDPTGPEANGTSRPREIRGGCWDWWVDGSTGCASRQSLDTWNVTESSKIYGARICLTIRNAE